MKLANMASLSRFVYLASAFSLVAAHINTREGQTLVDNSPIISLAAEYVEGNTTEAEKLQLTETVLETLTVSSLSGLSLFQFAGSSTGQNHTNSRKCKVFPGDTSWPSKPTWETLNLLSGGALIETVPIGAVCYTNQSAYNATACTNLLANWYDDAIHIKATNVFQIQLAVNFARNTGIRLVVKNTGHDFLGKSTGAGSLSIWTHNLKSIEYIESYKTPSYEGPVFRMGPGVTVAEMYETADKYGVTAQGGECKGVGVTGGYLAGGEHNPLISKFGMAADQVLSIDLVTPDGRFVTADEAQRQDLFWAVRGGRGATWGVVTTMFLYWRRFPEFADAGSYGYTFLFPRELAPSTKTGYQWTMRPWVIPEMNLEDFKGLVAPLFKEWEEIGFSIEPEFFEYDNFYEGWKNHFPFGQVALSNWRTAGRLMPRRNWEDDGLLNRTMGTIKSLAEDGSGYVMYNYNGAAPEGTPPNAIHPAWRETLMFLQLGNLWPEGDEEALETLNKKLTRNWMKSLIEITPGQGGYLNEGDLMDPDFAQNFWGVNYKRLLAIKKAVDPWDLFWAPTAVGSENWFVTGQTDWLTKQTVKLCRK
ncbi:hypothetical protein HYALB_00006947 [Hymenoscyphus albidus]|uniref:FAD-binding PCMH-type domain-containing protein n=1 Tax=Hymenoscyphus albidus TaxID=595503 RepID=A0A9N9LEX7_9HELO|nr:hypothetical protein HYALB_00006947 [Hymenoscyphus albidus]